MGSENKCGSSLRLRPQTIFSAVLEGGKTFYQLAKKYGFTLENFEKEILAKVGPKEFKRLKEASDRNWTKKQKRNTTKSQSKIKTEISTDEEKEQTEVEDRNMTEREKMMLQKANAEQKIASLDEEIEAEKAFYVAAKQEVQNLTTALKFARKKKSESYERLDEKKKARCGWRKCLSSIEERIKELDSETIYLIAPGYQGELPTAGKLISSEPIEGATVEDGEGLYKEISVEDLLNSGFERISDASNAYRFARLVIKYDLEGIKTNILIDDERIKRILKNQGLEI